MAASPGTAEPPESSDTHSSPHPPSSPELHPTQENTSLTTVAPSEMTNPDHATPVPPPPTEQSTVEHSEADQLSPTPIDEAEPPLSHPTPEAAPSASSAFEAIPTEKLTSPSPHPEEAALEVSHEVAISAPSPSSSPSPQIAAASLEDAAQPSSPPRTPPATTAHTSTGLSSIKVIAMASQEEAARPSPTPESMEACSGTSPALLMPPMESRPEGLLPQQQQQQRPPSPEMAFMPCENLEPVQPPPLHPVECTDASPGAMKDEVVEGTLENAASSLPVPEPSDGHMDNITPCVLPALDIGSEEMLSQQQGQPICPEMAPRQGENSKSAQPPPLPESKNGWSNALTNEVSALASEEATAALQFGAEWSSQEPVQTPMTSRMEAEPCSPETAPPGFEDFKSQWLPIMPPIPPAESTHSVVQVAASNPVGLMLDAATESLSAVETMDVGMDTSSGLLPPLKSGEEGRPQQPLLSSCSPMMEAAPCSPDMPPPGFENCKSSWLPLPTIPPLAETTHALPDVASTKAVAFVEKASFVPALESTDVETDTEQCRVPPLLSGTGSSLQGPLPRSPSPMIQSASCSSDTAPPGFENMKAMHVISKEAPQSSSLEAMDSDMDATPAVASPLQSEAGKSLPLEPTLVPSHVAEHTACSLGMVPSGSENVESAQLLQLPGVDLPLDETPDALDDAGTKKVTMEDVCNPQPVTRAKEEANGSILRPALEKDGERPLPHPEQHASPEIAPASFENSDFSQQTSPCLADTDPAAHASATMPEIVKSDKMSQPLSPLQAKETDMESATLQHSPLKSEERLLAQSEQHPSSTCSPEVAPPGYENLESSEELPPPPPLSTKFEMGQMVCGYCRRLLAYPKGSVHVQCFGCCTINLVLEEHQIGKVYCGQCDTLLIYPFGAPAVKCSNCLFVTEIGERNVRPRISKEQSVSPHSQEVAHQS